MEFTLKEAQQFAARGEIAEWIQLFLRAENVEMPSPNYGLADGLLLEERYYFNPMRFPLNKIQTLRVEEHIIDVNDLNYFKYKVELIAQKINEWDMPPFIIQFDGEYFKLTDGSHRFSALRKLGKTSHYAIIWCDAAMEEKTRSVLMEIENKID